MGIFGAMTTAVAGLNAQSYSLENIAGNIANSQTTAYKRVDTSFADLVMSVGESALNQNSGSVLAKSRPTNTLAGAINASQIATHMAISGDGYFQVQTKIDETNGAPTFSGANVFTRRGDFTADKDGYLVNGTGYYLTGIPVDSVTGEPIGNTTQVLKIPNSLLSPKASTTINFSGNLPANTDVPTFTHSATVTAANDTAFQAASLDGGSVTMYDSTGAAVNVQTRWAKDTTGKWNLYYKSDSAATGTNPMWTNLGTDFTFTGGKLTAPTGTSLNISALTVDGNNLGTIKFDFSDGITNYSQASGKVTSLLSQDGYASGTLSRVGISDTGRITASYSNGRQVDLAQIPLYQFNGDDALARLDGGAFQQTKDSGPPTQMSNGKITGKSLEASNTDIAEEFSKMIVTQQAYSANSKVITTADGMMQDILNIVR